MLGFDPRVPNQPVQIKGRRGVTTGKVKQSGSRTYVQVQFGPHEKSFIFVEDAERIDLTKPGVGDLLRSNKFGHKGDLARVLTFHKISSRLANVFYAMQTSRTDFYAYQFKPVYKFIESANGRILIADEVGLGKTIEAALIWQEVRARSDARTLLVVCPSMLREKWRAELRTRFDVPAEICDTNDFLTVLRDYEREGRGYQCAAVCSMQGLRSTNVQNAVEGFTESELQFDLIVIDEAHYMRNVDTKTHRLGKALSTIADNFLLLTATPLQLKREDLYRLLNVLDPDEYDNHALFESRTEANEPVVLAQNALRKIPADVPTAKKCMAAMEGSSWFSANPLLDLAKKKVNELDPRNVVDLIETTRLLENLNLLGSSISRTRKREVQEWKVIRKAKVLRLKYNDQEMAFYNGVTDAVRKQISSSGNAGFEAFTLMMPQRQMASCIPAMVDHYRGLLENSDETEENTNYELGWTRSEDDEIGPKKGKMNPDVEGLISNWFTDRTDSKYDALFKEIRALFQDEPSTKMIIFSYFKKTLSYLHGRLSSDGYPAFVIHGDIPMEERLEILDQFREYTDHRILLSSEVGSEGLDLQFCRVIINYDLPWNPMKVEQRIGRLDRLGQQSPSISIINVAAINTIEDRILERLYSRIGIFERSIGDLEPILGDMIHQLEFDLLSKRLTPEQEELRIEQTRLALEQKRKLEADLEDQSQFFFGNSDFVLERIRDARKTGRWITPAEIRSYVTDFFQKRYSGTQIQWDRPQAGFVAVDLVNGARNDLALFCRQSEEAFTGLTVNPDVVLAYTSEAANQQPRTEFLTHFHPLIRWITRTYFYIWDSDWGGAFWKTNAYAPFPIWLWLNGHEWAKRQLDKAGIGYEALDNGFRSCDNPETLQKICDRLGPGAVKNFFWRWLYRLPSPFTPADMRAGYVYDLAFRQFEVSDTRVFERPQAGRMWFEGVIRDHLDIGRPHQIALVFNTVVRRGTPGTFRTRVLTKGVDPTLCCYYKSSRLKQYFKEGKALRTETVICDTKDFGIGRRVRSKNWSALKEVGESANRRLCDAEAADAQPVDGKRTATDALGQRFTFN